MTTEDSSARQQDEWRSALDTFAAGVDAHKELLETGEEGDSSPWPPPSLPTSPLPAELREEALALLAAAEQLSDAMTRQLAGLPMRRTRGRAPRSRGQANWSTVL